MYDVYSCCDAVANVSQIDFGGVAPAFTASSYGSSGAVRLRDLNLVGLPYSRTGVWACVLVCMCVWGGWVWWGYGGGGMVWPRGRVGCMSSVGCVAAGVIILPSCQTRLSSSLRFLLQPFPQSTRQWTSSRPGCTPSACSGVCEGEHGLGDIDMPLPGRSCALAAWG